jgi:hypothetical protein
MAVAVFLQWDGFTQEQYDQVRALVPFNRETAAGALLHVATFDDGGARITDVWETAEQFQAYLANHLAPVFGQLGVAGQPEVAVLPIHALETLGFTPL